MFGCVEKVGISNKLPKEILDTIRYEEDLLENLRQINVFEYSRTLLVLQNNYATSDDSNQVIPNHVEPEPSPILQILQYVHNIYIFFFLIVVTCAIRSVINVIKKKKELMEQYKKYFFFE